MKKHEELVWIPVCPVVFTKRQLYPPPAPTKEGHQSNKQKHISSHNFQTKKIKTQHEVFESAA